MKGTVKNKLRRCAWVLTLMTLLLITNDVFAGNPKENILRQKMTEILSMRGRITEKRAQAIEIHEHLKGQLAEIKDEIKSEQKRLKTGSFQKAISFPRIDYNLKLVQRLRAYISMLSDKIVYFQIGNDMLEFLYEHADDDLRIVQILNDMKVEKLMARIDQVLQEYLTATNNDPVDVQNVVPGKSEKTWNEIMKGE